MEGDAGLVGYLIDRLATKVWIYFRPMNFIKS